MMFPDDEQNLTDLLNPTERLLFNALERQMALNNLMLRAYRFATWAGFIVGIA